MDPSGRHPLEVTVTDTGHGESPARLNHTPTAAAASVPRDEAGMPPPRAGSTSTPDTVRIRHADIRIVNRSPESDDASDTYVLEVFGLSVLIRLRTGDPDDPASTPEPFIHVDNDGREPGPLIVEVTSSGETEHHIEARNRPAVVRLIPPHNPAAGYRGDIPARPGPPPAHP